MEATNSAQVFEEIYKDSEEKRYGEQSHFFKGILIGSSISLFLWAVIIWIIIKI